LNSRNSHTVVLVACSFDNSGAGRTCVSRVNSVGSMKAVFVDDYSVGELWSDPVRVYLKELPNGGEPRVVVDLGQVELIKAQWIGGLIQIYLYVRQAGGEIVFARPHDGLAAFFKVMEICRNFELFETVEGAVAGCSESGAGGGT